jgi:hypothetical protein
MNIYQAARHRLVMIISLVEFDSNIRISLKVIINWFAESELDSFETVIGNTID